MVNVVIIGEGQTEETFVKQVLAPQLAPDIFLEARLIKTGRGGRGGALSFDRVKLYLRNTLRERHDTYVTTLFDLYALSTDFPGIASAKQVADPLNRAIALEQQFKQAVDTEYGIRFDRFLPYIQPYEFESLLFSDTDKLTQIETEWAGEAAQLQAVRANALSPEHINDGPTTHPSARLEALSPKYSKPLHGPLAIEHIGLAAIEQACAHFAGWLQWLRTLPPLP